MRFKKSILVVSLIVMAAAIAYTQGFLNGEHLIIGTKGDFGIKRLSAAAGQVTDGGANGGSLGVLHLNQPTSGTDVAGTKTLSGGAGTVTFATAFASAPVCTANDQTAANAVKVTTTTTTVVFAGTTTDVVGYICVGNPN